MTLRHIAAVMGLSEHKARQWLHKHRVKLPPPKRGRLGQPVRYPVEIIETIRALQGKSYEIPNPTSDWLAQYLKEGPHARTDRAQPHSDG